MNWLMSDVDKSKAPIKKYGEDALSRIADFFIIFFGTWTLIHQVSYFAGLTFQESWKISIFAAPAVAIIFEMRSLGNKWRPLRLQSDYPVVLGIAVGILLALTLYRPDADDQIYLAHSLWRWTLLLKR